MSSSTYDENNHENRPSGVPQRGKLGASKRELTWLIVGLIVFAAIFASFWFEVSL